MAEQRVARIVGSEKLNCETKLLTLELLESESLNFIGGQYIIVNTNIPLPGDRIAKRAYSLLSADEDQIKFNIAVKRMGEGPGSSYMHSTQEGNKLLFSGPWGQYIVDDSCSKDSVWAIATDTGITAALGLVQSSRFRSEIKEAHLFWLTESSEYFIHRDFIDRVLDDSKIEFEIQLIPSVNHPDRVQDSLEFLKKELKKQEPRSVFLSGDGAVLYPFKEQLVLNGVEERQIKIECFFNNPFKKVGKS